MKSMTNRELERKLAAGVEQLVPDVCQAAATAPTDRVQALLPPSENPAKRHAPPLRRFALAACLCLVLMAGAGAYTWLHPAARIGLEVNPSIQLTTNAFDRVLSADALNADAELVLGNLRLRGVDLDTAVSAIIGSIVQHGYFENGKGEVRITVAAGSEKRILRLEQQVSEDVRQCLPRENADVAVTVKPPQQTQTPTVTTPPEPVTPPAAVTDDAQQETPQTPPEETPQTPPATHETPTPQPQSPVQPGNADSNGKQAWIQRALALDPTLDAAQLQTWSAKRLRELVDDLEDRLEDDDWDDADDDEDHDDDHGPRQNRDDD